MSNEQLLALSKTFRQMREEDDAEILKDCPVCGEVLDSNGRYLNCPYEHGQWPVGTTQGALSN